MPGDIYDIPVVLSTTDRNSEFPTPATNQRVQNLGTSNIERYNGSAWGPDFIGNMLSFYNPTTDNGDYGPAITAAIAAANAAGGGIVYVPPGTWQIGHTGQSGNPIDFQSATGVTLQGAGLGTTLSMYVNSSNQLLGAIVASTTTRCAIRNLRLQARSGATVTTTFDGFIFAQAATALTIDNVRFENGGMSLNTCTYCTVSNTSYNGQIAPGGGCLQFYQCTSCSLINPIVEPFTFPTTGASVRCLVIQNSTDISVIGGSITGVDISTATAGGAGFSFSGCTQCSLTGMTVNGLKGADGILVEAASNWISISNCISCNNGATGSGSATGTGDGFDFFNSNHIRCDGCTAVNNGVNGGHPGFEIFTCEDVTISNGLSQNNDSNGFVNVGTPDLTLLGCRSIGNNSSGLYALKAASGVQPTNLRIVGGDYSGNNSANNTQAISQCGIYLADACSATITGIRATNIAGEHQQYGLYITNAAYATVVGCQLAGNVTTGINVSSTAASQIFGNDTGEGTVVVDNGGDSPGPTLINLINALVSLNIISYNPSP